MNWKTCYLYVVLGVCLALDASAQDAIQALLIQPELVMQNREQLKLSDEQAEQLRAKVEAAGPESQELKERSDKAMGKLAELLSADQVDEAATLKQLDEVIAVESDQKRLHMRVMIQVRNLLRAEQLQMAKKLQESTPKTSFLKQLTPPEVRAEVAALAKEDVQWRKIAWKTCLLDGLQASREQSKPVVLWIFIDRPIDDERC